MLSSKSKSITQKPTHIVQKHAIPNDPFEETIMHLMPDLIAAAERAARYKSNYSSEVRAKFKAVKKPTGVLGPRSSIHAIPTEFVRKGEGLIKYKTVSKHEKVVEGARKPDLPKNAPFNPDHTPKNFLNINKVSSAATGLLKPIKPEVSYKLKKEYGKTPTYLSKRMAEHQLHAQKFAQEESERKEKEALIARGVVPLPEEERLALLNGLHLNWDKLNSEYMRLSLTVDTQPKITRKCKMEKQLKALEDQMSKLSHSRILINFKQ